MCILYIYIMILGYNEIQTDNQVIFIWHFFLLPLDRVIRRKLQYPTFRDDSRDDIV